MKKYLIFIFIASLLTMLAFFSVNYRKIRTKQVDVIAISSPIIDLDIFSEDDSQCEETDYSVETPVAEVNENNPYARWRETFSGYYLYDIYEANRGSLSNDEWFIEESERFAYHEQYDPDLLDDENLIFEWEIELSEMEGTDPLSNAFNSYHQKLFEEQKTLMEVHQNEAMEMELDEIKAHWMSIRFSMSISTQASFKWGNIFIVVDMKNMHDRRCWPVIANFNSISGERYELEDLFCIENYRERLSEIVREEKNVQEGFSEYLSFMMGDQGLLLMDAAKSATADHPLIEWEKLEDIMDPEVWEVIQNGL